jgi:retinol dehydrogenase-12
VLTAVRTPAPAAPALDLRGRRYVITGANTGVGRATALALAARGADLVLACRSAGRAAAAIAAISALPDAGAVELVHMDLASLASVRRAAAEISRHDRPVDALINNAGVGGARGITEDGFELAFGVNFLGHYLLTRALLPSLAPGARIVHLSSGSHRSARALDLEAVRRSTASLTGIAEYAISKLCVMLFHHELARRSAGSSRISIAADPGDVASEAWRHVPWPVRAWMTRSMQTPEQGARTSVLCATAPLGARSPSDASGRLYAAEREVAPSALSLDASLARELWERSAAWVGLER